MTNVICFIIWVYTFVAFIANNMDPDQTADLVAVWSGFLLFGIHDEGDQGCIWVYEYMDQT